MARTRSKQQSKPKKSTNTTKNESARKRLQRYREKLKSDPGKLEETRAKDRERKRKAKEEGKIKSISELPQREQRRKRRHHKEYMRLYREKKKKQDKRSDPDPDGIFEEGLPEVPVPSQACDHLTPEQEQQGSSNKEGRDSTKSTGTSAQKKRGRKIVLKNRSATSRENEKLKKENLALQRLVWRMKKKKSRESIKNSVPTPDLTPRSKLRKVTEGRKISSNVRRELFKGMVLEQELKSDINDIGSNMKKKKKLAEIVSGRIIKKYRVQNQLKFLPVKSLRRNHAKTPESESDASLFNRVTPQDIIKTKNAVRDFFLSDEASHFGANKNSFVKIKGEKIQKRFMNDCLVSLYKTFSEKTKFKISFSTFCKYRPKEVVPPKLSERDSCLCKRCENFKLLCKALRARQLLEQKNHRDLIDSLCCTEKSVDCLFRNCVECKEKSVTYQDNIEEEHPCKLSRWELRKETRNGNSEKEITVKITKKVVVECSIKEAKNELEQTIYEQMAHVARITQQRNEWKFLQGSMSNKDLLITCDWSENWVSKCSAEVQSMHFGGSRQQFSLHTGFVQTTQRKETFCTVSDVTRHDPHAIYAHLLPILERHITSETEFLHVKSDGPTTQYRSKKMFYIVSQYIPRRFPQLKVIVWNFSEAGHGKDIHDGVGGTVKRIVDSAVAYGADVQSLTEFVEILHQKDIKTYIQVISKSNIDEADKALIIPEFKCFPGTMKIHQYVWVKTRPAEIICKSLSCYRCPRELDCIHYVLGNPYNMPQPEKPKRKECKPCRRAKPRGGG